MKVPAKTPRITSTKFSQATVSMQVLKMAETVKIQIMLADNREEMSSKSTRARKAASMPIS